jgi:hypothetical protein
VKRKRSNRLILKNVGDARSEWGLEDINAIVDMFSVISIEYLKLIIVILIFKNRQKNCWKKRIKLLLEIRSKEFK